MSEHPEVDALADVYETWYLIISTWQPSAGEGILCRDCEESLFSEASGLRGIAPHSVLHDLSVRLEDATSDVAHGLWLACDRCEEPDDDMCAHHVEARVRVLDRVALSSVDLISAAEELLRRRHGWEREYAVRRLDEFLEDAARWTPSPAMLAVPECIICSTHPLRGEAHIRRLPHDLRHDLYRLVDEIAEEFADTATWMLHADGERPIRDARNWARSLMLGLVGRSSAGIDAFVETVVDTERAKWVVDRCPLTLHDVAREIALAAARPDWEALLQARLEEVIDASSALSSTSLRRRSINQAGRSPYALVVCPDLRWPAWLIDRLVSVALELRRTVCRSSGDSAAVTFDAWLFERLRSLAIFEHRIALTLQRTNGEEQRRQLGLRLLAPIDDSIVFDF